MPVKKTFLQDLNRLQFAFGLTIGIALLSLIGFFTLLFRNTGTAAPRTNTNTTAAAAPTVAPDTTPTGPVELTAITDDDHIRGDKNAPVTIVEFSDLQCPFCQSFHPTLQRLMDEYDGEIRWVYKHFPLDSIHPQARPAALAAECAAEQEKFWEFIDASFENQSLLGDTFYADTAKSLGLNTSKFNECYSSRKYEDKIDAHYDEGTVAGVTGTPSSFVNGQPVSGALPYAAVKSLIDTALADAS